MLLNIKKKKPLWRTKQRTFLRMVVEYGPRSYFPLLCVVVVVFFLRGSRAGTKKKTILLVQLRVLHNNSKEW